MMWIYIQLEPFQFDICRVVHKYSLNNVKYQSTGESNNGEEPLFLLFFLLVDIEVECEAGAVTLGDLSVLYELKITT